MRTDLMLGGHQNDVGLNHLLGPSNMDVETARGPELDDFGDRLDEAMRVGALAWRCRVPEEAQVPDVVGQLSVIG